MTEHWPSVDDAISKQAAKNRFNLLLRATLVYHPVENEPGHYELLYAPTIHNQQIFQINALMGKAETNLVLMFENN